MSNGKSFVLYLITNTSNGKVYVGITRHTAEKRWVGHRKKLRTKTHPNRHLQAAYNRDGEASFKVDTLQDFATEAETLSAEVETVAVMRAANPSHGYNKTPGGEAFTAGMSAIVSRKQRGRKFSPEHLEKLRVSHLGKALSDGAKEKLSAFWTGKPKPKSSEHRAKLSAALLGNRFTGPRTVPRACSRCNRVVWHKDEKARLKAITQNRTCRSCAGKESRANGKR